jgi:hypothetical protein
MERETDGINCRTPVPDAVGLEGSAHASAITAPTLDLANGRDLIILRYPEQECDN